MTENTKGLEEEARTAVLKLIKEVAGTTGAKQTPCIRDLAFAYACVTGNTPSVYPES